MCGFTLGERSFTTLTAIDLLPYIHIFLYDNSNFTPMFDVIINKDQISNGFHDKFKTYIESSKKEYYIDNMNFPIIVQTERIGDTACVVLVCENPGDIILNDNAVQELKSKKVKEMIIDNDLHFDALPDIFNEVRFDGPMPDRSDVEAVQHWYEHDKWDERVVRNAIHSTMWKLYDIAKQILY